MSIVLGVSAPRTESQEAKSSGQDTTEARNASTSAEPAPHPGITQQKEQSPKTENAPAQRTNESPSMTDPFWSNWALVLIGLGIAILAIRSLRVIYDQTIATERAVASAEKIAVAADATLKVVKETAERELRAYVLPIKGGMFEDRIHAGKSSIRITIKNIGKTPAFHFSSCLSVGVFEFPTPDNLPSVTASRGKGSFPLAPDGETELEGILAVITPEQLAHLAARTKAVYAFGELRYQDAFGAERRTKFRMFCNGEWLAKGRFLFSGEGNEAD